MQKCNICGRYTIEECCEQYYGEGEYQDSDGPEEDDIHSDEWEYDSEMDDFDKMMDFERAEEEYLDGLED